VAWVIFLGRISSARRSTRFIRDLDQRPTDRLAEIAHRFLLACGGVEYGRLAGLRFADNRQFHRRIW